MIYTVLRLFRRRLDERRDESTVSNQRGAVLIEFALTLPLLVLIALGIVESGMLFKTSTDLNSAVRNSARAGTSAPAFEVADRTILRSIGSELDGKQIDGLYGVVVFKANGVNDTKPPDACIAKLPNTPALSKPSTTRNGILGVCNVYTAGQVSAVVAGSANSNFASAGQTTCTGSKWDGYWCPVTRTRSIGAGTLDYIGVYVKIENTSLTGIGLGNTDMSKSAVFRLEPKFGDIG